MHIMHKKEKCMLKKKIKLFDITIGKEEEEKIIKTIRSGFWASGAGTGLVNEFEKKFLKYTNADECIAVNSATSALHLALSLLDIKGKEVVVPSLTFVATAHAVLYNGGIPVFADVDPNNLCLDPVSVRKSLSKKTKVILPVHFGGMPANLNELSKIAQENDLDIIEDAAHAAGTKYDTKKIGSHSSAVCFSFHPIKNLSTSSGGMISLNGKKTKENKEKLLSLRWFGISDRSGPKYDVSKLGWNYYMNEFAAALGIVQLKKLDRHNKIRKKISKRYFNEISLDRKMEFNNECSHHLYWIFVKNRDKFMKSMLEKGIETGIHYFPVHQMSYYNDKKSLPNTIEAGKKIVTLPIHANLTDGDIDYIVKHVNKFAEN